ncbi:hypothetical protein PVAP13_9KG250726 [Panicum virgatum]|uniref:Uncharacterized protein n=1 Tax=Panicum virgatum TaxID=38727 RepID=A0A8T0NJC3_PANVG|nr:hypothetical protein PVAP13_9KG250726 [Panicum virgatum]
MCCLQRHLQRLYQQRDTRELISSAAAYQFPLHHTEKILLSNADQSDKTQGSMTLGMAVDCRKKHNHPVVPRS